MSEIKDYESYGYDGLLNKKDAGKLQYMSQADTDVYIESIGQNKVRVNTDRGAVTVKTYIDSEIGRVIKLI